MALHKIFEDETLWENLNAVSLDVDARYVICTEIIKRVPDMFDRRNSLLSIIARDLEFAVQSLCTTAEFYKARLKDKIRDVKVLKRQDIWEETIRLDEELEDAREVIQVVRRQRASYKGKGRKKT